MIPLVDIHCHLLAGLDDGPRTDADALAMCRIASEDGIAMAAATAHQNDRWSAVTPDLIRQASSKLSRELLGDGLPLSVFPCAEVMAHTEIVDAWERKEILSVADRGQFMLIEMPDGVFVDLRDTARDLSDAGVRPILAHPERHAELLHEPGQIEQLIHAGCLIQVSSSSITDPATRADARALKRWFQRGVAHLVGSDGHSPRRRAPKMAEAYQRITQWAGSSVADRVCSTNAMAILQGLPLRVPQPEPTRRRWFPALW